MQSVLDLANILPAWESHKSLKVNHPKQTRTPKYPKLRVRPWGQAHHPSMLTQKQRKTHLTTAKQYGSKKGYQKKRSKEKSTIGSLVVSFETHKGKGTSCHQPSVTSPKLSRPPHTWMSKPLLWHFQPGRLDKACLVGA